MQAIETRSRPDVGGPNVPDTALAVHQDAGVQRAVALARLLDDRFLDPIVGLVLPGAGDLLTAGVGLYIVGVALRRGLPAVVVARMLLHLAFDMLLGAVPVAGDVFDFVFKANSRNARLLVERQPGVSSARDWAVVAGAALLFAVTVIVPLATLAWMLGKLFG